MSIKPSLGKRQLNRLIFVLALAMLLLTTSSRATSVAAQEAGTGTDTVVETIFNQLTPAERVGQLFVVSFEGRNLSPDSNITRLIQTYRIGGVVISAENSNFVNNAATAAQVLSLTNELQALTREMPQPPNAGDTLSQTSTVTSPLTTTVVNPQESYTPLPLFIAVHQEGDGYPHTNLRGGLTNLPSPMALGATWAPENARMVGETVGRELSLLGVNMLLGPSLDVLDDPRSDRSRSLGVRAFGGHPFWVAEMGEAYIAGVHQGSNNQVLTIAAHFPGFGSSDREINQGVPTIIKSLDDMLQTELRPFFRVTDLTLEDPDDIGGITDGLMTAHIRYQGLQGNVPISLDARNLPAILALKEIAPWREAGGLVVSAPLGVPAALEGIAASTTNFPARRLAQDAFLAGSDLLMTTDFAYEDDPTAEFVNITDALNFFVERYNSDANFKIAVDRAVRNILKAKVKIYGPDLLTAELQKPASNLELLDETTIDLRQIAQAAVTLITPLTQDGVSPLPGPPQPDENILIFVDDRMGRDCPDCTPFPLIETTKLEEIILGSFGPEATGQISPEQITSLGFTTLKETLAQSSPDSGRETEALIEAADWIIFAMLDIDAEAYPPSDAVRVLLRNRYESLRNKTLVLFAFNAPYFLDETEISQLTAYYGFYSKEVGYLETAARLLFQQFEPSGASPVGIPAIGPLDLSPDPNQTIQLEPVLWIDEAGTEWPVEAESLSRLDLEVGQTVLLRTSVVVDRNGNPVPDGTLVSFFVGYPQEGVFWEPIRAPTENGIAEISIVKDRDIPLQVRAFSDLAAQTVPFDIGPGIVDTPTPTPSPTPLPTDTPVPTPSPTLTPAPTEAPTLTPAPLPTTLPGDAETNMPSGPVDFVDLAYSLLGMLVVGGIGFTLGGDRFSLEERVRPALIAIALGLVGYIGFTIAALTFGDAGYIKTLVDYNEAGHWVAPLISLLFAVVGVVAWYLKPGRIFGLNETTFNVEMSEKETETSLKG